jgi:hypothetical protein
VPDARLELALIAAARRYAPSLVPAGWARPGDYPAPLSALAASLARHHVLATTGVSEDADGLASVRYTEWAGLYTGLYTRISAALFPSYPDVNAFYADQNLPPILLVHGQVMPVIDALARYIVPFVAARQGTSVTDMELLGLIDRVLEALEGDDLPRAAYRALQGECAGIVRALLGCGVRQRSLVGAAPELGLSALPDDVPAAPPAPPDELPETGQLSALPDVPPSLPEDDPLPFRAGDVPIFFSPKRTAEGQRRRPPVPDLPE